MSARTTCTMVTFNHQFVLSALEEALPPGTYWLTTNEEQIVGLSFLAYCRAATSLHVPEVGSSVGVRRQILVDPVELAAALDADRLK